MSPCFPWVPSNISDTRSSNYLIDCRTMRLIAEKLFRRGPLKMGTMAKKLIRLKTGARYTHELDIADPGRGSGMVAQHEPRGRNQTATNQTSARRKRGIECVSS